MAATGTISVVIPCYNVETYVGETLCSVLNQSYRKLDVVVVDDSSTDGTLAVVNALAQDDPRVRVFERPHQGVNAARNFALRQTHGEYLTFLDGDDVLLEGAYADMVAALKQHRTDFVVGGYDRLRDGELWPAASWIRTAHKKDRGRTTVQKFPQIMVNAVQWTKLYRRAYWDEKVVDFALPGYYQDQPVSARAYARAEAFTVLARKVVLWRVRDELTSMTQQVRTVDNMRDRFATATAALRIFQAEAGAEVATIRHANYLNNDIAHAASFLEDANTAFWDRFRDELRRFVELDGLPVDWTRVHARQKVHYHLILAGERELAAEFRAGAREVKAGRDHLELDGDYYVPYPFWDRPDVGVPRELYRVSDVERRRIERARAAVTAPQP
jgi:CDP-glycerol glycerophosphotransferase